MSGAKEIFEITRRNELYHDGELIGRFGSEWAAADTAIRYAQDADTLYQITYNASQERA